MNLNLHFHSSLFNLHPTTSHYTLNNRHAPFSLTFILQPLSLISEPFSTLPHKFSLIIHHDLISNFIHHLQQSQSHSHARNNKNNKQKHKNALKNQQHMRKEENKR
ncbi:hypothetical protein RYX36_003933 [Vicia faba]